MEWALRIYTVTACYLHEIIFRPITLIIDIHYEFTYGMSSHRVL